MVFWRRVRLVRGFCRVKSHRQGFNRSSNWTKCLNKCDRVKFLGFEVLQTPPQAAPKKPKGSITALVTVVENLRAKDVLEEGHRLIGWLGGGMCRLVTIQVMYSVQVIWWVLMSGLIPKRVATSLRICFWGWFWRVKLRPKKKEFWAWGPNDTFSFVKSSGTGKSEEMISPPSATKKIMH